MTNTHAYSVSFNNIPDHVIQTLIDHMALHNIDIIINDGAGFSVSMGNGGLTLNDLPNNRTKTITIPTKISRISEVIFDFFTANSFIDIGTYRLDYHHRTLISPTKDTPLYLTEKETDMIRYMHNQSPRPITRDDFLKDVWGYSSDADTHTIETHMYRLRQKIEDDPDNPKIIQTTDDGYVLGST